MADRAALELRRKLQRFLLAPRKSPRAETARLKTLQVLNRPFEHGWPAYLVGGFLRDLLTARSSPTPRDFDLVVHGCSFKQLNSVFRDFPSRKNRFGGLNLRCSVEISGRHQLQGEFLLDVWRLEDTWGIRNRDFEPTMDAFVRTPFLNIDSIAVSVSPDRADFRVFEHGFFDSLEKRCIEINYIDNPYPALCAARAMILAVQLDFCLGIEVCSFIREVASRFNADEFCAAHMSHYGFLMFSSEQFDRWIREIRSQSMRRRSGVRLSPSEQKAPKSAMARGLFPSRPPLQALFE